MGGSEAEHLLALLSGQVDAVAGEVESGAVLFSGGLDSSIIARMCSRRMNVTLYSVGTAGSHDLRASVVSASQLGLRLVSVVADEDEVLDAANAVRKLLTERDGAEPSYIDVSIYAPVYFLMGFVKEEHVFSGQGADELFGGYRRYLRMEAGERAARMRQDASALISRGTLRDIWIAEEFGKKLHLPYLSPGIVAFAAALPEDSKIAGGVRKVVLRECATLLSVAAATSEKKAMQYGSGFEKVIRKKV